MSDARKKFHEIALKSGLFKGRNDWYFCYLKSEKIAHVLILLAYRSGSLQDASVQDLVAKASLIPQIIARLAAGQTTPEGVLADMFGVLTAVRLCTTLGFLSPENSAILEGEYEQLVAKISASNVVSPFLSNEDFALPGLPDEEAFSDDQLPPQPLLMGGPAAPFPSRTVKDNRIGQDKGQTKRPILPKGDSQRATTILTIVRKNKGVSVSDIASIVKDCSEKTIQRELASLIDRGLVRKQGERRWSVYFPI